jgi:hypothetical protein
MPLRSVTFDSFAILRHFAPVITLRRANVLLLARLALSLPCPCRHKSTMSVQVEGGDSKLFYAGVFDGHGEFSPDLYLGYKAVWLGFVYPHR